MTKYFYFFLCFCTTLMASSLSAQGGDLPPPPEPEHGMMQTLIMLGIGIVFFYLILIRPEQQKHKALEDQRSSMQKGSRVTAMGIIGTVIRVQEETVIVKMYDGSKIEFLKGAISDVQTANENSDSDKEEASSNNSGKRVQLSP
ncbi:MAG: preprotein translocase subunit YajC [Halioglobus sp.]|jgi:preprotein translocase subunit YajC